MAGKTMYQIMLENGATEDELRQQLSGTGTPQSYTDRQNAKAAAAAAAQPTYSLPADWFNGMSRIGEAQGWKIDDSDSATWQQIAALANAGNTQGAINLANQLAAQGKFGGYYDDQGNYWGFAQGYTGGANASMQPVIGGKILTPKGLEAENTNVWLTPDGKALNYGQGGTLTNNGETWGTTDTNPYGLTGRWFNENQPIYGDIRDTTMTAWGQQQGWSPEETMLHMAEAGMFTNPELNTGATNLIDDPNKPATLSTLPGPVGTPTLTPFNWGNNTGEGGMPAGYIAMPESQAPSYPGSGTGSASGGASGGASYQPQQPMQFEVSDTPPELSDPTQNTMYQDFISKYDRDQGPQWTGGEFDYTQVPEYKNFQDQYGNQQAPQYGGDPYQAQRDAALAAYGESWGGSDYQRQRDEHLQNAANMKWNYNPDTDPVWQALQKQYRREGQRATEDTLGRAAAMTGGMPSTAAVSAASQAGNYYASQLSDRLPQVYQDAYNRYLQEYQRQLGLSDAYAGFDNTEYQRWLQGQQQNLDLANAYNQYGLQDYSKYQDTLNQWNTDRNFARNMAMDAVNMSRQDFYDKYGMYQDEYKQWQDQRSWDHDLAMENIGLEQDYEKEQYQRWQDLQDRNQYLREYTDKMNQYEREWAQKLQEYADEQGWKRAEWEQYLREYQDQLSQNERDYILELMQYEDEKEMRAAEFNENNRRWNANYETDREKTAYEREMEKAELAAKYGDYSGLEGMGIDTSNSIGYNYAYSADGSTYDISSQKGMDFLQNAPIGATMTGGDGSKWTKNADGTTTITKNGKTWTYGSPAAPATSGSGKSSGTGSGKKTGSGSGSKSGSGSESETDALSSLTAAGIKSEGEAYNWLLANGYGVTAAGKLAKYYAESLGAENGAEGEAPADQTADYRNLTEALDRMAQNGRSRDEIYTEINAAVRDGLITKEQGEALKNNYYGTSDNVPNSNQTHSGGRPQSQGFNAVYQEADSYFSRGDRNKAIQAISDAYNAGKIHEYEIDIIMDRLGL